MSKLVILVCAVSISVSAAYAKSYKDYKVFEITPMTDEQVQFLRTLERDHDNYQYWKDPTAKLRSAHLMVTPQKLQEFSRLMNATQLNYEPFIENVQALINRQKIRSTNSQTFSWTSYHTYDEINNWLDSLAETYKSEVEVIYGGKSHEGRDIKGVKVSFSKTEKPAVFVESGIHANEWLGPATVTYILNEFLTSNNSEVHKLAESFDWYIFPIFNPDGYVYTFQEDRLWRKTRVPHVNGCYGVDPNRNWDYQWMNGGASDDPCHNNYAGKKPFSEVETKTLSNFINSISKKLFAFISFHTYGQHLLLPYGHTTEHLDNYDELYSIGNEAIKTLAKRYGTMYDIGNIPEVLYIDSGSSMDWVKGKLRLPITYTYELRDTGNFGFLAPPETIILNGKEVLDSIIKLFEKAYEMGYPEKSLR